MGASSAMGDFIVNGLDEAKDIITSFITGSDVALQMEIFRVIDSLTYYKMVSHQSSESTRFQFCEQVANIANFITLYVEAIPLDSLVSEMKSLNVLRPPCRPLRIVYATSSASTNIAGDANPNDSEEPNLDTSSCDLAATRSLQRPVSSVSSPVSDQSAVPFLGPASPTETDTYPETVRDLNHARTILAEYQAANNKCIPAVLEDGTGFPPDRPSQAALVQELLAAMIDTHAIVDKKASKKRKRTELENTEADSVEVDNPQVQRVKTAPRYILEAQCWVVLYAIRDAQHGDIGVSPWRSDSPFYKGYDSFRARFDAVKDALRKSKAVTDGMMAPDFARLVAAHPEHVLRKKESNHKNNSRKKRRIDAGVKVVEAADAAAAASAAAASAAAASAAIHAANADDDVEETDAEEK